MKNLDTTHYDKLEVLLEEVESEKEFRSISNGKNYYVYGNFIAIYGIGVRRVARWMRDSDGLPLGVGRTPVPETRFGERVVFTIYGDMDILPEPM